MVVISNLYGNILEVIEIDAFITGEFKIRMIHFLLAGENRYYHLSE